MPLAVLGWYYHRLLLEILHSLVKALFIVGPSAHLFLHKCLEPLIIATGQTMERLDAVISHGCLGQDGNLYFYQENETIWG